MSLLNAIERTARRHGGSSLRSGSVSRRHAMQAPVGGWNTRDAFANMRPKYAIRLDNYFPEAGRVRLRRGSAEYAMGLGSAYVETLFPHRSGDTNKFYAVCNGSLYDVTAAATPSSLASSLTGNVWQHTAFNGSTILVNGEDNPMRVQPDGALASAHGWQKEASEPGTLTPSNLYRVLAFKGRVFFLEKDSAKLWYGDLGAVQGDLRVFRLDRVHPQGGNAIAFGSITIDAGVGVDDLLCIFMSNGSVLVYQGTDISNLNTWRIVGIWEIGALVGDRPLVKFGGDLVAMTTDGYVRLSKMLIGGREQTQKDGTLSDTIAPTVTEAARLYGDNPGWDCILYTPANYLLFNVPESGGVQHVLNTQTGAWCRFTGLDARCWATFNDKLYFGGADGHIFQADTGSADDDMPIEGDVQNAYNYLGSPNDKRFTMARALIESDAAVSVSVGTTTDFNDQAALGSPTEIVTTGAEWDEATWDTADWAGGTVASQEWRMLASTGTAISLRIRSSTKGARISYYASDIFAERTDGITL